MLIYYNKKSQNGLKFEKLYANKAKRKMSIPEGAPVATIPNDILQHTIDDNQDSGQFELF